MTSPDDLIRRDDALEDLPAWCEGAIRALPAAPLPDDVVDLLSRVAGGHYCPIRAQRALDRYYPLQKVAPPEPPDPVPWVPSVGDRVDVAEDASGPFDGLSGAAGWTAVEVTLVWPATSTAVVLSGDRTYTVRISDLSPAGPARDEPVGYCGGPAPPQTAHRDIGNPDCPECGDPNLQDRPPNIPVEPARDERPVDPVLVRADAVRPFDLIVFDGFTVQEVDRVDLGERAVSIDVGHESGPFRVNKSARVLVVRDRGQS